MSELVDGLSARLAKGIARHGVPGASFALWRNGEMTTVAAGLLNAELGTPVLAHSMFQVGSIAKPFTATLLMQIVEQGRVDLDRPIGDAIEGFRVADLDASKNLTLRQLLCHTSGLAGDYSTDTGGGPDKLARFVDRCALLPQVHQPGRGFSYSNSGYMIAGRVAEIAAARTWERLIHERIFTPLGLRNSSVEPKDLVGKSVAIGHAIEANRSGPQPVNRPYLPACGSPAGATLTMSASDLVCFAAAHLENGPTILSTESMHEMQRAQVQIPIPARGISHWGIGWFIFQWGDDEMFGHDGTTHGQNAFLRIHRPSRTIAVLLTNGGAAQDLMDELFERVIAPAMGVNALPVPQIEYGPPDLERYTGKFSTIGGETVISLEAGKLIRESWFRFGELVLHDPPQALRYIGGPTFVYRRPHTHSDVAVSFLHDDPKGRPQSMFSGLRLANRVS